MRVLSRTGKLIDNHGESAESMTPTGITTADPARKTVRPAMCIAAVVIGIWLLICTFLLASSAQILRNVRAEAEAFDSTVNLDSTILHKPQEIADQLAKVKSRLGNPALAPIRSLPVIGPKVNEVREITAGGLELAVVVVGVVDELQTLTEAMDVRNNRISALHHFEDAIGAAIPRVEAVSFSNGANAGFLRSEAAAAEVLQAQISSAFADAETIARVVAEILAGPRRYLILGANNAEMRAGSGMFLGYSILEVEDGEISLTGFDRPVFLAPPAGVALEVLDLDMRANWHFAQPSVTTQSLNLTPRFPVTGALAKQLAEASTGKPFDGVIAIDPQAVSLLVEPWLDEPLHPPQWSSFTEYFLYGQYKDAFPMPTEGQLTRDHEDNFTALSSQISRLLQKPSDIDPISFARNGMEATTGRHFLAWSSRAEEQVLWKILEADGDLNQRSLLVALNITSQSKLDWFVPIDAEIERIGCDAARCMGQLTITASNIASENNLHYYYAPEWSGYPFAAGEYVGHFAINLPSAFDDISIVEATPDSVSWARTRQAVRIVGQTQGKFEFTSPAKDGPTSLVRSSQFSLLPGESVALAVTFSYPAASQFTVESSARIPSIEWRLQQAPQSQKAPFMVEDKPNGLVSAQ